MEAKVDGLFLFYRKIVSLQIKKKSKGKVMGKARNWNLKAQGDEQTVRSLASSLCTPKENPSEQDKRTSVIISNLLVQRGVTDFFQAKSFFRPDLNNLHDPFLMKGMERAVNRIFKAKETQEKILIYGDYDVDGTTAVALVYSYLREFYANIDFYIPDRYEEGYGVSFKGVDYAKENNISLIICLDCGIKATEEIKYANERNIDFIVCDHHLPSKDLPEAYVILDAKLEGATYPYKELSGCGVGFKLIQALQQKRGLEVKELEKYLDLVAVSIAADVVPLTGENRTLMQLGLKRINTKPCIGLEEILLSADIKCNDNTNSDKKLYFSKELTIADLGFSIGPRINAAGRMDSGRKAVELLIATDRQRAKELAEQINENNEERKRKDKQATQEAEQMLKNSQSNEKKSVVLYNEQWHQGIIGIVASRIAEQENKPVVIFTKTNDVITGSARSVKNFDIYTTIEKHKKLLTHFGGHKFAAGLSLKEENYETFKQLFEQEVEQTIQDEELLPEISVDMEIKLGDINDKLFRLLNKELQPFGPDNNEPVFYSTRVYGFLNSAKVVGKNHLKFSVISTDRNTPISCIGFCLGDYYPLLKNDEPVDICYTIEENEFRSRRELQLNIKDIRKSIQE